jgi:predicted PurR-regulated permease PerM
MTAPETGRPPASPPWAPGTRLIAAVLLVLLAAALLGQLRGLIAPIALALFLAYVLDPIVGHLARWTHTPRWLSVTVVFCVLLAALIGSTTGIGLAISQQVSGLVTDLIDLSSQLPERVRSLSDLTLTIGPWTWKLTGTNLGTIVSALASTIQPLLSQTGNILASVISATASTVGFIALVIVLSFYMLLDFSKGGEYLAGLVPMAYRTDYYQLMGRTERVWRGFLRGQVLLAVLLGVVVSFTLAGLGVRFAIGLGVIAGVLGLVPFFGPFAAGLLAILVAYFQGSNWWGLTPFGFAIVVLVAFVVIQQVESNVLGPLIIGDSLDLHPLLVLVAALAGAVLGGLLGVLLSAPIVATLRIWLGYAYRKTVGLDVWPEPAASPPRARRRFRWPSRRAIPTPPPPPASGTAGTPSDEGQTHAG